MTDSNCEPNLTVSTTMKAITLIRSCCLSMLPVLALILVSAPAVSQQSVARQWNELLLQSIRGDFARPTVHARNLYHVSVATKALLC